MNHLPYIFLFYIIIIYNKLELKYINEFKTFKRRITIMLLDNVEASQAQEDVKGQSDQTETQSDVQDNAL